VTGAGPVVPSNADNSADDGHIPVLLPEVIKALEPRDGEVYVDGTFGAGGYSRAVLLAADCKIIAIDRDPDAVVRAEAFAKEFEGRFQILTGCFGDVADLLEAAGTPKVDGVMLDIGVSSFQFDEAERGFSFSNDGPLDMRMGKSGETAADVVNDYSETDIANIIYKFGEERKSRRIASAILRARAEAPITRTAQLAGIIEGVLGRPPRKKGKKQIHPATRTFQALRIYVNDELGELERVLVGSERCLKEDGRLVVVAFHSLEDRIVKKFMTERGGRKPAASRHMPDIIDLGPPPSFYLKTKGAVKPGEAEQSVNRRARSARLRVGSRTAAAAWGEGSDA